MNIVLREIYANKKSLLIWSLSIAAFIVMMFIEFAAYYKNPEMLAVIDAMPREMLEAFGMADANLTTVSGYMKVAVVFINIALSMYAVILGNSILSKEERDKTAGFLMTLPITRKKIFFGKLVASFICCMILLLATALSILISIVPYELEEHFFLFFLLILITSLITMLVFLSIGMLLSALTRRHKISGSIGIGLVFTMYIASILASLSETMEFLRFVSPFLYFDPSAMLRDLNVDLLFIALSAIIIVISLVVAIFTYDKRDLYV